MHVRLTKVSIPRLTKPRIIQVKLTWCIEKEKVN